MRRGHELLRRLARRRRDADRVAPAPCEDPRRVGGGGARDTAVADLGAADHRDLAAALQSLSVKKQVSVYELWPAPRVELPHGLTATVRSSKERRRFLRPVDEPVVAWFAGFSPGDVLYDIGANCGSLTLAAAGMHRDSIGIVAIEPGYANFESLVRNLDGNQMLSFVVPLQVALLDRTGIEPIHYYRSTSAGGSLHAVGRCVDQEENEFIPVATQMVPTYTLDDALVVLKLPQPTHVKIDVDGTEGALLKGATGTLARGTIKELLIEIVDHDRAGTRLSWVSDHLRRHGYERVETFSHKAAASKIPVADHLFRRRDERSPG